MVGTLQRGLSAIAEHLVLVSNCT